MHIYYLFDSKVNVVACWRCFHWYRFGHRAWDISIIESGEADISVDLDANPGGEDSCMIKERKNVSISYNEYSKIDDFAVIMLAAQHLEAWKRFFLHENVEKLPPLSYILERLFD